jgi:hypothetical protein
MFIPPGDLKRLKRNLVDALIRLAALPPPSRPAPAGDITTPADAPRPASVSKQGITLRLFNRSFPVHRDIGPDRWLFPFEDRGALPETIDPARIGFWLSPVTSWRRLGELARALDELPDQEFLCMGWEAFELARRLPRHRFRLDWCFNLANTTGCETVRQEGVVPTAAREWPAQHPPAASDVFWSLGHNPLVSLSRFPALAERNRIITNPHRDRFFLMELAPGTTGLFLVSPLAALAAPRHLPLQIDVAVAPHESPFRVLGQIEQLIAAGRNRNRAS